jgi:hypothetical protein
MGADRYPAVEHHAMSRIADVVVDLDGLEQ